MHSFFRRPARGSGVLSRASPWPLTQFQASSFRWLRHVDQYGDLKRPDAPTRQLAHFHPCSLCLGLRPKQRQLSPQKEAHISPLPNTNQPRLPFSNQGAEPNKSPTPRNAETPAIQPARALATPKNCNPATKTLVTTTISYFHPTTKKTPTPRQRCLQPKTSFFLRLLSSSPSLLLRSGGMLRRRWKPRKWSSRPPGRSRRSFPTSRKKDAKRRGFTVELSTTVASRVCFKSWNPPRDSRRLCYRGVQ